MRRTEVLQGVRMLKFRDVFGRCEEGSLSKLEAAELLGVNERTFRRSCRLYEEEGEAGLSDRRVGNVGHLDSTETTCLAELVENLQKQLLIKVGTIFESDIGPDQRIELSDVSRPIVYRESLVNLCRYRRLLIAVLDEQRSQQRSEILASFAQRRHAQAQGCEPKVQIRAEPALLAGLA